MGYNEEETALGDGGETDGLVNILVGRHRGLHSVYPHGNQKSADARVPCVMKPWIHSNLCAFISSYTLNSPKTMLNA